MIIDCISDLHGYFPQLEGGDLLIVAGDLTADDQPFSYAKFDTWLHSQKYLKTVVVAGNHDNWLANRKYNEKTFHDDEIFYLCDSGTEFAYYPPLDDAPQGVMLERQKFKIWGSPWTKRFEGENPNCLAFTCETEEELAEHWKCIPEDTDILVTHSPLKGYLDQVKMGKHVGSESLFDWWYNSKARLRLWCFGHIHEAYGKIEMNHYYSSKRLTILNASHVNERYEPVNKPIRIEL